MGPCPTAKSGKSIMVHIFQEACMSYKRLLPTTVALLLAACGSSNGSTTNLKPVFFRTVAPAPVATLTMQRQNGAPMTQAKVTLDPVVLTANPAVPGGNATSVSFSTELFKGSFRAVITATPVASTDNVAPFETAVINAAGGGATEPQSVGLASGGNLVSLHFADSGGAAVPDAQIGTISIYDAGSLVFLNSGNPSGGVATL